MDWLKCWLCCAAVLGLLAFGPADRPVDADRFSKDDWIEVDEGGDTWIHAKVIKVVGDKVHYRPIGPEGEGKPRSIESARVRISDGPPPPEAEDEETPPPKMEDIAGIYLESYEDLDQDPEANEGERVESIPYVFLPNGFVAKGEAIAGGIERFDPEKTLKDFPERCGTFVLMGKKIKITLNDGHKSIHAVELTGEGVQIHDFDLVSMLPAGHSLSGRYWMEAEDENIKGDAITDHVIAFKPDGTYSISYGRGQDPAAPREVAGKYAIRGNTLTMTCVEEAKVTMETIFLYPDAAMDSTPDRINIDGQLWTRITDEEGK